MNPVTKWKVGLQSAPWRPLTVDGDSYLLKSVADDHGYHVAISDLVSIWFEQLDADVFHARSKVRSHIHIAYFLYVHQFEPKNITRIIQLAYGFYSDRLSR